MRNLTRASMLLLTLSWLGCRIYDADRLDPQPASPSPEGGMADGAFPKDGAPLDGYPDRRMQGDACTQLENESCNEVDDDCDEKIDEDIDSCLPHAGSRCVTGICVFEGCLEGFCNCNGIPNDGCEVAVADAPDVCRDRCTFAADAQPAGDGGMLDAATDAGLGGDSGTPDAALDAGTSDAVLVTAINSAGSAYTSAAGIDYVADVHFTSSSTAERDESTEIAGTEDDPIYRTERWSNDFQYQIPVEDGSYRVLLQFAETYWDAAGQRMFDVTIEGELVLDDLDIYAEVGSNAAYDRVFDTTVADGSLTVHLSSTANNAEINGLVVWRLP